MKGILLLVTTGGALALSGVTVPDPVGFQVARAAQLFTGSIALTPAPVIAPGGAVFEAASLLLLGGGFFAAAMLVRRRG